MELYPVVLEHAAAFLRRTLWEVSRDPELLAMAHLQAHRVYGQNPVVCGIDVYNIEAEAWGATVECPDGNGVPILGPPPLSQVAELACLRPLDIGCDGRLPVLLQSARSLRRECPDVEVRVPLAGPFSIAVGLLGFETMLVALMEQPEAVAAALLHLADQQAKLVGQFTAHGLGVTLYESAASPPLVPPALFQSVEMPALTRVLQAAPMACILGGDVAPVAAALLAAGPTAVICPAETDQAAFLRVAVKWPEIAVRVNLPATSMTCGVRERQVTIIRETATLARHHPRSSLGTGVLPYATVPESILELMVAAGGATAESGDSLSVKMSTPF